jgi:hypothetical protein
VAAFQPRSATSSKFPAGLKRSAPAQPAVVLTTLEVNMRMHISVMQCTLHLLCSAHYISNAVRITSLI